MTDSLLSSYCIPNTDRGADHMFSHLILSQNLQEGHTDYSHIMDGQLRPGEFTGVNLPQMTKAVSGGEQTTTEYPPSVWFHVFIVATGIENCSKAPICSRHLPCTPSRSGVDFSTPGI